jgi:hypothetical protein
MCARLDLINQLCSAADSQRIDKRYAEAEPLYLKALKLAEEGFGNRHLVASVVCNDLAVLYKDTGRIDRAEQLYRRSLTITETYWGQGTPRSLPSITTWEDSSMPGKTMRPPSLWRGDR